VTGFSDFGRHILVAFHDPAKSRPGQFSRESVSVDTHPPFPLRLRRRPRRSLALFLSTLFTNRSIYPLALSQLSINLLPLIHLNSHLLSHLSIHPLSLARQVLRSAIASRALVLYPGPGAVDLETLAHPHTGPAQSGEGPAEPAVGEAGGGGSVPGGRDCLIVVDGTWRQAREGGMCAAGLPAG
jgi:hypothetical protein